LLEIDPDFQYRDISSDEIGDLPRPQRLILLMFGSGFGAAAGGINAEDREPKVAHFRNSQEDVEFNGMRLAQGLPRKTAP
jgi:hypothetical protein